MQYLTNWRIQRAACLLREGTATVATIAQEVGYDSEAALRALSSAQLERRRRRGGGRRAHRDMQDDASVELSGGAVKGVYL